mmetsp:Transcript_73743/g.163009  ORF Transcript_73743/g.163009 Transcript_73743/m.163009 type:complete len:315 (-) Transcript_73743:712-1656(-)
MLQLLLKFLGFSLHLLEGEPVAWHWRRLGDLLSGLLCQELGSRPDKLGPSLGVADVKLEWHVLGHRLHVIPMVVGDGLPQRLDAVHILLQHRKVRRRYGLGPIRHNNLALWVHLDLVPEGDSGDVAIRRGSHVDRFRIGVVIVLEIEFEAFENVGELPRIPLLQSSIQVYHEVCAVVVENREVESMAVLHVLAEFEGASPEGGARRDAIVLKGVATLDPRSIEQDKDAFSQKARIDELADDKLGACRLARQLPHLLRTEKYVSLEVIVLEGPVGQPLHLGHLLEGDHTATVGLDVFVCDARLPGGSGRDHGDLP